MQGKHRPELKRGPYSNRLFSTASVCVCAEMELEILGKIQMNSSKLASLWRAALLVFQ